MKTSRGLARRSSSTSAPGATIDPAQESSTGKPVDDGWDGPPLEGWTEEESEVGWDYTDDEPSHGSSDVHSATTGGVDSAVDQESVGARAGGGPANDLENGGEDADEGKRKKGGKTNGAAATAGPDPILIRGAQFIEGAKVPSSYEVWSCGTYKIKPPAQRIALPQGEDPPRPNHTKRCPRVWRVNLDAVIESPVAVIGGGLALDTQERHIELWFTERGVSRREVVERGQLTRTRTIVDLATKGLPVDETNARGLIVYLRKAMVTNAEELTETYATSPGRWHWGHLDLDRAELSLCLDPTQDSIVRVRAAKPGAPDVEAVPNALGQRLRCPAFRARSFAHVPGEVRMQLDLFRRLVHAQQALDETDRLMSTAYNLAALFPGLGQRPMKFNLGAQGQGKTTAMQDYEIVLYGEARAADYKNYEELANRVDSGGPIITQDNAETKVRARFTQVYNVMATGGVMTVRQLYSNNKTVDYRPNGSLCLTAIEGMTQPEQVGRVIEFGFDKAHWSKVDRPPHSVRVEQLKKHGDVMLSGLLNVASTRILPGLRERLVEAVSYIERERPGHAKERFNEFLALMFLWVEATGEFFWDADRAGGAFDAKRVLLEFIDSQNLGHRHALLEANPVVQYLDILQREVAVTIAVGEWSRSHGVKVAVTKTGDVVIGPVTTSGLFTVFGLLAKQNGLNRPFDNPRQLGQRIAAAVKDGTLASAGWTRKPVGKVHGNYALYEFSFETLPAKADNAPTTAEDDNDDAGGDLDI